MNGPRTFETRLYSAMKIVATAGSHAKIRLGVEDGAFVAFPWFEMLRFENSQSLRQSFLARGWKLIDCFIGLQMDPHFYVYVFEGVSDDVMGKTCSVVACDDEFQEEEDRFFVSSERLKCEDSEDDF